MHLDLAALGVEPQRHPRRARRDQRRDLPVGRAQLRAPRPPAPGRPRARGWQASLTGANDGDTGRRHRGADRPAAGVVPHGGLLRGAGAVVPRLRRQRHRRLRRPGPAARLPRLARRRLPVAPAVLPLPAARRGLRRERLHRHRRGRRHPRGLHRLPRRRPRARAAGDRRLRDEPHQRPAPLVPGQPHRPRGPVRRVLRVGRRARRLRRRADHLRRLRDLELDLGPGPQAVLLAPLLLPPARPQLRQPTRARGDPGGARPLARPRRGRLPPRRRALPVRAGGQQRREPPRDPRVPPSRTPFRRRRLARPVAARRGQPVARRRRRLLRGRRDEPARWSGTSATCASTSR